MEHPFGTLKRQWGYSYVLTKKGMERASADVGLMLVAYNLRRIFHIIGWERLLADISGWVSTSTLLSMLHINWQRYSQRIKNLAYSTIYLQFAIFNQPSRAGF